MLLARPNSTFLRSIKASCLVCDEVTEQELRVYRFRRRLGLPRRPVRTVELCKQCGNHRVMLNRALSGISS